MAGRRRSHRSRHSDNLHTEFDIWIVHGIQGTETSTGARRAEWWQGIRHMLGPNKTSLLEYNHRLGTRYSLSDDSIALSAHHLLEEIHEQLRTAHHNNRSVILVGYEVGGTIVKRALLSAIHHKSAHHVARHVSLLVFFNTPHRARSQDRWEEIANSIAASSSYSDSRRHLSHVLMHSSQELEYIPGLFGVCNGYHASGIVSEYSATMGLSRNEESVFVYTFKGTGRNTKASLAAMIQNSRCPDSRLIEFLRILSRTFSSPDAFWVPPRTTSGLNWISLHPQYRSWGRTLHTTLHLQGRHRSELSDLASYLARHAADCEPHTVVARFSFKNRSSAWEMLAATLFQFVCQRPQVFHRVTQAGGLSFSSSFRNLFDTLERLLGFMFESGARPVVVLDAVDRVPEGRHSGRCGFSALQQIQLKYPLGIIVTSVKGVSGLPGAYQARKIYVGVDTSRRSSGFHDWPNAADFHLRGGSGNPPSAHDDIFSDQDVDSEGSQDLRNDDGSTALHIACEAGAGSIVRQMLDDGADMAAKDEDGATPLHIASKNGYPDVIKELLARGSDPMAQDDEGLTPVHLACEASCREGVEILLDYLESDLPIDKHLRTPLHSAIEFGGIEIMRHVLNHYLDHWGRSMANVWPVALEELLLREDNDGFNALHTASRQDCADYAAEILLRAAAHDVRDTEQTGSSKKLKDLLLNSQDLQGRSPLHLAVNSGNSDTVRLLCEEGIGGPLVSATDTTGQTALHLACAKGDKTMVTYLLRYGAPIDAVDHNKDTPAIVATRNGHEEILWFLIDCGASLLPGEAGSSPIHEAVASRKADIVEELLDMTVQDREGVYVDLRRIVDQRSRFPAMIAAQKGDESLFQLLLADETQLSIMDLDQRSILHHAAEGGNGNILLSVASKSWLFSHLNSVDCFGYTPLRLAAEFGRAEAIEILLECNPAPSAELAMSAAATDAIGLRLFQARAAFVEVRELVETIHNAARKGHLGTLRAILSEYCPSRLCPDCANEKGKSALMLAAEAGQLEVVRLLVNDVSEIAIDKASKSGRTALSYAAEHGHMDVVEFLAKYLEVNVDSEDVEQRPPVFFAAMNGHLDIVKLLVASSRSRSSRIKNIFGALCAAAEGRHMDVVKYLLRKGGNPSKADPDQRLAVLERGLREGHVDLVRVLAKHTFEEKARDGQPLLHLAWKHPETLREALRNVDVDAASARQDVTALGLAVKHGYVSSAVVLLEHGADVLRRDQKGRTPLHYAASVMKNKQNAPGQKTILRGETLELLLRYLEPSKTADVVDSKGNTPLSDAVAAGAIGSVRVLLARGDSDIARLTYCGHSPFWVAVEKSRYKMVSLMLDMVPRPQLNSPLGESYLDVISEAAANRPKMQALLLDRLPDIDLSQTWVCDLVKNDTTGILVKFLLAKGVNSTKTDEHGWSLMDFAHATDKILCRDKTDHEIARIARQKYRTPDRWVSVATDEQRAMIAAMRRGTSRARKDSGLPAVFAGRSASYAPYRADHPIPPTRAYYWEVKIVQEGTDRSTTGFGLCTKDADMTELDPSEPRISWKNLGYMYFGSGRVEKSGKTIGHAEQFGEGDVIGCHVDLAKGIMYFRKNGRKIGLTSRANELLDVSGRLFPCFVTSSIHCLISADFGPSAQGSVYDREEEREFEDSD